MIAPARPFNPFPGLRPFEPDEDHLFFGREEACDQLLRRLRTRRFLAVVGTSGSGKSSLIRSGLVPTLYSGLMAGAGSSWRVALMRPGGDPFGNLAAALNDPEVLGPAEGGREIHRQLLETTLRSNALGLAQAVCQAGLPPRDRLLIVVDQFEELFRLRRDREPGSSRYDAKAFVRVLLSAIVVDEEVPVYVVITMRSDFIGDCMEFPYLPEMINDGLFLVPRMRRAELRQAISGPVAVGGGEATPRLVRRLLNDVGDDPDQLPILQHALMRTWDHWQTRQARAADRDPMDLADYRAVGKMDEALSGHAEKAYSELETARQRAIAGRLFRSLTDTSTDRRGVRRPCSLREICAVAQASPEEVVAVVERFRRPGRSFLMPPAGVELHEGSILDISHESLMRIWGRLRAWAERERRAASFYRRLARAAALHEQGEGGLWRKEELGLARAWKDEERPTAAWAARYEGNFERAIDFLDTSEAARADYLRAQARRQRTRRLAGTAAVAVVLGGIAVWQSLQVRQERRRVAEQEAALRSNRILAVTASAEDPRLQTLLLGELDPRREPPGGVLTLLEIVERLDLEEPTILERHDGVVIGATFLADRPTTVTAYFDGEVNIWSSDEPVPQLELRGHEAAVYAASFSPAGDRVVTASEDRTARIWRSDGGAELAVLRGHAAALTSAEFSADGERVVTASPGDGTVRIWNAGGSGDPVVLRPPAAPQTATFDPQGGLVATGSIDGSVRVWSLVESPQPLVLGSHGDAVATVAFSRNGQWVVTASDDGTARIWSVDGLGETIALRQQGESLGSAVFSHDGRQILTTSLDGTVRIWNSDGSGDPILLGRHAGSVQAAAFRGDDARVLTASDDGISMLWRVRWKALVEYLRSQTDQCLSARQRIQYLLETPAEAQRAVGACEARRAG